MRFLVADDDEALRTYLKRGLEADGHEVRLAADGQEAIQRLLDGAPEMAILDLTMPRLDGAEVLRIFRSRNEETSILILSARNDPATRLACLELGADDCMLKPFSLSELRARVRAIGRRRHDGSLLLRHGVLEMDRVQRTVTVGDEAVALTQKEYALLECLLLNRGRAVSRARLLEQAWKTQPEASTNIVDVYVNYLRRKLGRAGETAVIETVRGQGYAVGLRAGAGADAALRS